MTWDANGSPIPCARPHDGRTCEGCGRGLDHLTAEVRRLALLVLLIADDRGVWSLDCCDRVRAEAARIRG